MLLELMDILWVWVDCGRFWKIESCNSAFEALCGSSAVATVEIPLRAVYTNLIPTQKNCLSDFFAWKDQLLCQFISSSDFVDCKLFLGGFEQLLFGEFVVF